MLYYSYDMAPSSCTATMELFFSVHSRLWTKSRDWRVPHCRRISFVLPSLGWELRDTISATVILAGTVVEVIERGFQRRRNRVKLGRTESLLVSSSLALGDGEPYFAINDTFLFMREEKFYVVIVFQYRFFLRLEKK